jgi:hypothetical protein
METDVPLAVVMKSLIWLIPTAVVLGSLIAGALIRLTPRPYTAHRRSPRPWRNGQWSTLPKSHTIQGPARSKGQETHQHYPNDPDYDPSPSYRRERRVSVQ